MDYAELGRLAEDARKYSYCAYSGFSVGAALLTKDGRVYQGCNIENASYPAGICAERTAFVKALSEGERDFSAIAIAGGPEGGRPSDAWPCGICRQFMSEFSPDIRVLVTWGEGAHVEESTLQKILPHQFELKG